MSALRRQQKSRQRTKKLAGRVFADCTSHRRLRFEALEQRQLLSVTWTGGGNDSNWDDPQNWNTQAVPGAGDDVVIDTGSVAATVNINSSDSESVNSLRTGVNDTLSITGGSLTVAANSTLSGSLAMTGGSLTASGTGITLTVNGSTTVSNAGLSAQAGATLSLPNLTSYAATNVYEHVLEATGAGSTLALANLTGLTAGDFSYMQVTATAGGTVNLPLLAQINTGPVLLFCDGAGSMLDLSALADFSVASGSWTVSIMQASNGGTIEDGSLTSLAGVDLLLDGVSTASTSQITSFTGGVLSVSGTFAFGALTDLDNSSVTVEGGASLSLPAVRSYTENVDLGTLQATGRAARCRCPS
jgi:hypothetical protein